MKKLILVAATTLSLNVMASSSQYRFVGVDETVATQVCLSAATKGINAAKATAKAQNIAWNDALSITCNNDSLKVFARKYQAAQTKNVTTAATSSNDPVKVRSFVLADQSLATKLCAIAAQHGFKAAQEQGGSLSSDIICNGKDIRTFARQMND